MDLQFKGSTFFIDQVLLSRGSDISKLAKAYVILDNLQLSGSSGSRESFRGTSWNIVSHLV